MALSHSTVAPLSRMEAMVRIFAIITFLMCSLTTPTTSAAFWDKQEEVDLQVDYDAKAPVKKNSYQKIIIRSASVKGFCEDSYTNSVARNLIGSSNKALLLITIDKTPIMKMEYDNKTKQCTKATWLEKEFRAYELENNSIHAHQFNLIYSSTNETKIFDQLVTIGAQLTTPTGQLLALPVAKNASSVLDIAFAAAANSGVVESIDFRTPSENNEMQIIFHGRVGNRRQRLFDIDISTSESLFEGSDYSAIMTRMIDGTISPQQAIEIRRSKDKINFRKGDLKLIQSECSFLKSSYETLLNRKDAQRMQEAYLLNNHRGSLTTDSIETCTGYDLGSESDPISFKSLIDEVQASETHQKDTKFLSYLYDGQSKKILQESATFFDKDGDFGAADITQYINLKGSSTALCHTYVSHNRPAYIQIINSKLYYVRATVDKEYTIEEASNGSLSKVEHIVITKNIDSEYENIPGVKQCIGRESQRANIAFIQ